MGEVVSIKKKTAVQGHNAMIRDRIVGVPAKPATPATETDPRNPNR